MLMSVALGASDFHCPSTRTNFFLLGVVLDARLAAASLAGEGGGGVLARPMKEPKRWRSCSRGGGAAGLTSSGFLSAS